MTKAEILEEAQINPEQKKLYDDLMVKNFLQVAMANYVEQEAPEKLFGSVDKEEWLKQHLNIISEVVNHDSEVIAAALEVASLWTNDTSRIDKVVSLREVAIMAVDRIIDLLHNHHGFHEDFRP